MFINTSILKKMIKNAYAGGGVSVARIFFIRHLSPSCIKFSIIFFFRYAYCKLLPNLGKIRDKFDYCCPVLGRKCIPCARGILDKFDEKKDREKEEALKYTDWPKTMLSGTDCTYSSSAIFLHLALNSP